MKCFLLLILVVFSEPLFSQKWQAKWITAQGIQSSPNTWLAFRKNFTIKNIPSTALAKIAVDSKYWLWINGKLVVFEGGLKRGPNPHDTYYDEVNIASSLVTGNNTIEILVWYFGKEGFSHKSSGKAGLLFDCELEGKSVSSDRSWLCKKLEAYQSAGDPLPNYRLPESSLLFDARKRDANWRSNKLVIDVQAEEIGDKGSAPWNNLLLRPIPLFKNFGLQNYIGRQIKTGIDADTIICRLPYNAQVTPYLNIECEEGKKIIICTDNYLEYNGGATNLRTEYITRKGIQDYESFGWINGHFIYYIIPKGVRILSLQFRETGYKTEFAGSFHCSDPFFNRLWTKSRRTLYLTMRDTYMDCPDRERAQWTGDAVHESGEAFYALSPSAHALAKKWLLEIINWQRADGSIFAPVPAGNWDKELPDQTLASVGYYGLWNYYLHTGDRNTLAACYEGAKKYLLAWKPDGKGTMQLRQVGWTWGDWGTEKDIALIFNCFYYLAVKGMKEAAITLGKKEDIAICENFMKTFKDSFNNRFWTGKGYRHPTYVGRTDDRVQALAVVAGLADKEKYAALLEVFKAEEHASPYMEKYVMEALFQMGETDFALARHKKRFALMVNHPVFTTLWEGWNINDAAYGGGTINHAWSGGALTILSQYLCGIAPVEAAYKTFQVMPQPGTMESASATVVSVAGKISSSFENKPGRFVLTVEVPPGTRAIIGIPSGYNKIVLNDKLVWQMGASGDDTGSKFTVKSGRWKIIATL